MTFTGNADYDFDMGDMIMALGGGFTLSTLFAGPEGMALLTLFATGVIGLSFPWMKTTTHTIYRCSCIWFCKISWTKTNKR